MTALVLAILTLSMGMLAFQILTAFRFKKLYERLELKEGTENADRYLLSLAFGCLAVCWLFAVIAIRVIVTDR